MRKMWNTTDHSVTVDEDGRQVDGYSTTPLDPDVPEVRRALDLGLFMDQGEAEEDDEQTGDVAVNADDKSSDSDTESESSPDEPESGTLTTDKKATAPKSTKSKKGN